MSTLFKGEGRRESCLALQGSSRAPVATGLPIMAECGSVLSSHTEAHLAIAERNTEAQKEVDGLRSHVLAFGTVGLSR